MNQVIARALNDPAFIPTFISIISMFIGFIAGICMLYATHRYGAAIHTLLDPPDGEGPGRHGRPLHANLHIYKCLGLFGLNLLAWSCFWYLIIGRCWYRKNGRRKTIRLKRELVPKRWRYAILIPGYVTSVAGAAFLIFGNIMLKLQA